MPEHVSDRWDQPQAPADLGVHLEGRRRLEFVLARLLLVEPEHCARLLGQTFIKKAQDIAISLLSEGFVRSTSAQIVNAES